MLRELCCLLKVTNTVDLWGGGGSIYIYICIYTCPLLPHAQAIFDYSAQSCVLVWCLGAWLMAEFIVVADANRYPTDVNTASAPSH